MKPQEVPHVLLFPFPIQGHVNSLLKLAELLCLAGLNITFLNTEYNHKRLLRHADVKARFHSFPSFRFEFISDGLPDDSPRALMEELLPAIRTVVHPTLRNMLISGQLNSYGRGPISCIIADGILGFTIDLAKEIGIPSISFRTPSSCYYWICCCLPRLIQDGDIPFTDDNLDEEIKTVPGMEGILRRRDLPSFFRAKDLSDAGLQLVLSESIKATQATSHILNTFEDLEASSLSELRTHFGKIYTLGPLHALLNSRRNELNSSETATDSSNSLLEVDRSCMTWLDSQPSKSVVYVSFGSVVYMTHYQMLEFWHGLVNSGKRFLWVIRPDSVTDKEGGSHIPMELLEATKERGYKVDWCPQEEVLVHPSVGGFFTHSGWNSTLEAMVAGLPMICWPQFADQPTNSRFVEKVWKIGFDMKDNCDRLTVEKMVKDMMDDKREELMISVNLTAEKAKRSISEGGSSYQNLELLIEDLNSMAVKVNK